MQAAWNVAGPEPALDDLLHDPIVELLMRRDQIGREDILRAVQHARRGLDRSYLEPTAMAG